MSSCRKRHSWQCCAWIVTSSPLRLDPLTAVRIASRNAEKARELIVLWGAQPPALVLAGDDYPDVAETANTYEGNALIKACALASISGGPALADDSGIEVEAMGWGPAIRSARSPSVDSKW